MAIYNLDKINYQFIVDNLIREISGREIYGFAFKEDDRARNLYQKPVKGVIVLDEKHIGLSKFYKLGKNGKLASQGVYAENRTYADTYEEAINGYNELVNKTIDHLKQRIKETELELIKIK